MNKTIVRAPIIALVLMVIGSIGILIAIGMFIWLLVSFSPIPLHNPDPFTTMIGSFIIGQAFFGTIFSRILGKEKGAATNLVTLPHHT